MSSQLLRFVQDCININTPEEGAAAIVEAARFHQGFTTFTLNLDHLVKLSNDQAFKEAYSRAKFVTADGAPILRIARRKNAHLARTTGADLLIPICQLAASKGVSIFFFGPTEDTIEAALEDIEKACEGELLIRGWAAPSTDFDPKGAEAKHMVQVISGSDADICVVSLGAPKQEIFADYAVQLGAPLGFLCFGAAMDFIARKQTRAPLFLQKAGLEWLWRLGANPRRMVPRYTRCAIALARIEASYLAGEESTIAAAAANMDPRPISSPPISAESPAGE
jgi:N-acetylglucosaminyldiphosphoundecaprenol N-acetyl-beta-D-mannosaminyltransferase